MIELDTERDHLNILLNKKIVIQNISYKLAHDKNVISFFDSLIGNIKNYNNMDRMERYYFEKDFTEIRKILNLFFDVLFREYRKIPVEKIIKCCNIFSDNIGKRIVMQISYIPLLDGFVHRIHYEKNKKDYIDDETMKTISSIGSTDDFTDYDKRNKYLLEQIKEYEKNKDDIDNAINILIKEYEQTKDINKFKIELGKQVWNDKVAKQNRDMENFAKVIKMFCVNEKKFTGDRNL